MDGWLSGLYGSVRGLVSWERRLNQSLGTRFPIVSQSCLVAHLVTCDAGYMLATSCAYHVCLLRGLVQHRAAMLLAPRLSLLGDSQDQHPAQLANVDLASRGTPSRHVAVVGAARRWVHQSPPIGNQRPLISRIGQPSPVCPVCPVCPACPVCPSAWPCSWAAAFQAGSQSSASRFEDGLL